MVMAKLHHSAKSGSLCLQSKKRSSYIIFLVSTVLRCGILEGFPFTKITLADFLEIANLKVSLVEIDRNNGSSVSDCDKRLNVHVLSRCLP